MLVKGIIKRVYKEILCIYYSMVKVWQRNRKINYAFFVDALIIIQVML